MGVKLVKGSSRGAGIRIVDNAPKPGRPTRISGPPAPELTPHPQTGAVYVVIIDTIPAFSEIRAAYDLAARRLPWLGVATVAQWPAVFARYRSSIALLVNWQFDKGLGDVPRDRKATVASVYDEAMDPDLNRLLPWHLGWWRAYQQRVASFDAVLCCTPWMAEHVGGLLGKPSAVLPVGWDPDVLGTPSWGKPHRYQAALYGSVAGRRDSLYPAIQRAFGPELDVIRNAYAGPLCRRIDDCKTVLYVGHSAVRSYSTRRIWQAVATSAALVTEPGDHWPLEGAGCVEIPILPPADPSALVQIVRDLSEAEASSIARQAHEQLRSWTVQHCIEEYLVKRTTSWLRG